MRLIQYFHNCLYLSILTTSEFSNYLSTMIWHKIVFFKYIPFFIVQKKEFTLFNLNLSDANYFKLGLKIDTSRKMLRYLKTDEIKIRVLPFQVSEPSFCYDSRTVSFHFHSGGPDSVTQLETDFRTLVWNIYSQGFWIGLFVTMSANMRMMQRVAGNLLYFTKNV